MTRSLTRSKRKPAFHILFQKDRWCGGTRQGVRKFQGNRIYVSFCVPCSFGDPEQSVGWNSASWLCSGIPLMMRICCIQSYLTLSLTSFLPLLFPSTLSAWAGRIPVKHGLVLTVLNSAYGRWCHMLLFLTEYLLTDVMENIPF